MKEKTKGKTSTSPKRDGWCTVLECAKCHEIVSLAHATKNKTYWKTNGITWFHHHPESGNAKWCWYAAHRYTKENPGLTAGQKAAFEQDMRAAGMPTRKTNPTVDDLRRGYRMFNEHFDALQSPRMKAALVLHGFGLKDGETYNSAQGLRDLYATYSRWSCGDPDMLSFLVSVTIMARIVDDYEDGDATGGMKVGQLFQTMLFDLPTNAFYRRHENALRVFMALSYNAWEEANSYERGDGGKNPLLLQWGFLLRHWTNEILGLCVMLKKMETEPLETARLFSGAAMREARKSWALGNKDTVLDYIAEHTKETK